MSALTVHNAELKTAAVEVQTLTISGKQVTLAVFRQLKEEALIADDGTLNGLPWGAVNYHPDKCGGDSRAHLHLHVVWQLGTELRRSRVDKPSWIPGYFLPELADELVQAAYCANGHRLPSPVDRRRIYFDGEYDYCHVFRVDGINCITADGNLRHIARGDHECTGREQLGELNSIVQADVASEKDRRRRLDSHWSALNDLPQLFIAV